MFCLFCLLGANSTKHHHNGHESLEVNNRSRHSESEEVSMISGGRNRLALSDHGTDIIIGYALYDQSRRP